MKYQEHNIFLDAINNLLKLNISDLNTLHSDICKVLMDSFPHLILCSLLTYNSQTEEIIYNAINFKSDSFNRDQFFSIIKNEIVLQAKNSMIGRLIDSKRNVLKIENVLEEADYPSIELAKYMNLKKAIFFKLKDPIGKEIHGFIIIYPSHNSPINNSSNKELAILISIMENIIYNAIILKEDNILKYILDSAKKVKKDLSSFLQKCTEIISRELGAKGCSIYIVDPIDNLIRLKATLGIKPGPEYENSRKFFKKSDVYYRIGEGYIGKIVQSKRLLIARNLDISKLRWIEKPMSSTFLGIPIFKIDEDKVIGVITCATKPNILSGSTIEAFNHLDIELLIYISQLISIFIEISFYQEKQNQLIAKMPHEIRSSLTNIIGICDLLKIKLIKNNFQTNLLKKQIIDHLDDILIECDLSLMTVNSLSVFEDNIEQYEFEYVDIYSDIIKRIIKMLNPIALQEKNIKIDYINNYNIPRLFIDKYRMQLVFQNLILNAIKYSYRYSDKSNNIRIESNHTSDMKYFSISISDYGIPIPQEHEENIFITGFRTLDAISVDPSGKGFGLGLVKNILTNHNCKIIVTSLSNPTTFTIYIPASLSRK